MPDGRAVGLRDSGLNLLQCGGLALLRAARRGGCMARIPSLVLATAFIFLSPLAAAEDSDLADMSLEELLNLEVTSVSKTSEPIIDSPAAVFVITNEDLKRSGVTSIPEALRLAPGVNVARIDANKWAISARGFSDRYANKLLVLIDGRSIYTPLFSGVYWQAHHLMLEDVERIEVIRGPGAALWGANAVNGVINIITKNAKETQETLITGGIGTELERFGSVRIGEEIVENGFLRVYGKYALHNEGGSTATTPIDDNWELSQGGARFDWEMDGDNSLTLSADIYNTHARTTYILPVVSTIGGVATDATDIYRGGNASARLLRRLDDGSELQLSVKAEYYETDFITLGERRTTIDIDIQHRSTFREKHELVWGVVARSTDDRIDGTEFIDFLDGSRNDDVMSGFVQDKIALSESLMLTLGTKFEHNTFTGWEIEPSAKVFWTPDEKRRGWAAISRAVRIPSRGQDDIRLVLETTADPTFTYPTARTVFYGDKSFNSENVYALELGYRELVSERLTADVTAFYNIYSDVQTSFIGAPFAAPIAAPDHTEIPLFARNDGEVQTYGFEMLVDYQTRPWWRIRGWYSFLNAAVISGTDHAFEPTANSPRHQVSLQNKFDVSPNTEIDVLLRYASGLNDPGKTIDVDGYVALDVRFGWAVRDGLVFSVVGQNLIEEHFEFQETIVPTAPSRVERSVYGQVTWEF